MSGFNVEKVLDGVYTSTLVVPTDLYKDYKEEK